jgi:hypothetical protein
MEKSINYKGITRIPSDNGSFDGEMEELYNLVNHNGELRPVVPPTSIGSVSGELLFVHKNSGYEHFITLDSSIVKAYDYRGQITEIGNITNITGETLIKCEAVGNMLIILTDREIKYALWKDTKYLYLGKEIPFPVVNFTHKPADSYSNGKTIEKTFSESSNSLREDALRIIVFTGYDTSSGLSKEPSEEIASPDFENTIKGKINSFLAKASEDGLFVFPFFVRYALRMYDGSLTKHSMPILILPTKFEAFQVGATIKSADNVPIGYNFEGVSRLAYSHQAINLDNYRDIIQSVDIFISEPIYTYLYNGHINGISRTDDVADPKPRFVFGGITKAKEDTLAEISSVSNFYYVHSIPVGDLKTQTTDKEVKVENINTLVNRERMTDDYLSHDLITAKNAFTYNNKLHLSGITRTSFRGFKLDGNKCYYDNGAGAEIGIGSTPYIFYPGKAKELLLVGTQFISDIPYFKIMILELREHKFLNGFYYLDPNLENITNDATPSLLSYTGGAAIKTEEPDKIYVSAHQNPLHFPPESRITLPVSSVIAMASNTQAISQGQFGQFPLFVFTGDGIWALEINQEGKYIARQPVSREVALNGNILQMDNALAFITAKGITVLSGSQTECISDIIKDNDILTSKVNITPFVNAILADDYEGKIELQNTYLTDPIEYFLEGASLAYEYINGHGRLYAINEQYQYAYVFDILSKTWSKVMSEYKRAVNNYPDTYAQSTDGSIKALSFLSRSRDPILSMFVTRPIKLENILFSIRFLKHRGITVSEPNTIIYASRNGIDYQPIKSGSRKLLSITGSPYRYFKIVVIARLHPTDVLSGIDISLEPRYTNRLR